MSAGSEAAGSGASPASTSKRSSGRSGRTDRIVVNELRHVAIIGMMAVGKTTVGRVLAEKLGRTFVDVDAAIVEQTGKSVAKIFAEDGEAFFRSLEHDIIVKMLAASVPSVISLGGGAVLAESNRVALRNGAFVVWLRADPETLLSRIGDPTSRPLLADDPVGTLLRLDLERRELYAQTAHYAVEVDRRSARWVATTIARRMAS